MRALVIVTAVAALLSLACGRANPRLTSIVRSEGELQTATALQYDSAGRVLNVERSIGDEPSTDVTRYTWTGDTLTEIKRTLTLEDAFDITTTVLAYQQNLLTTATAIQEIVRPEQEPLEVSEEVFAVSYDVARIETLTRTFADDDGNRSSTLTTFSYDDDGLVEVRADSIFENNGARDQEISTVTTIAYQAGRPVDLSIAQDEGRATTQALSYKKGVLENAILAIPALDDFGNELTREGTIDFRYDADERLSTVTIAADAQTDIVYELGYVDGDASALDLMPAEVVAVPLWDLRGAAYDVLDARTQVARFVGASF